MQRYPDRMSCDGSDRAKGAGRRPDWLKVRLRTDGGYRKLRSMVDELRLNTVCTEARCPNIWECWNAGTATFMILGDTCTRRCGFCAVASGPKSLPTSLSGPDGFTIGGPEVILSEVAARDPRARWGCR